MDEIKIVLIICKSTQEFSGWIDLGMLLKNEVKSKSIYILLFEFFFMINAN